MLKSMKATIAGLSTAAMLATSTLVAVPAAQAETGYYGDAQLMLVGSRDNWKWNCGKWKCKNYRHHRHHRHHGHDNFPSGLFFGLAAGALLGSALAQPHHGVTNWDAYCKRKFRSYKPWTGTYTGYDGYQHRCP
jgi:hypothetical protein